MMMWQFLIIRRLAQLLWRHVQRAIQRETLQNEVPGRTRVCRTLAM